MGYTDKITGQVKDLLNEKLVQIALVGGILFYIVASPALFKYVDNIFKKVASMAGVNIALTGQTALILHSFVFSFLLVLSVKFILDPLMSRMK